MFGRNRLGTLRLGQAFTAAGTLYLKTVDTATANVVGIVPRQAGKRLSSGPNPVTGTIRPFGVSRTILGISQSIGTVKRATSKTVALATSETVGTVARNPIWSKVFAAATSEVVGIVTRQAGKIVSGTATAVGGTVRRAIGRTVSGTSNAIGTIKRDIAKTVATATSEVVGTVARQTGKVVSGTVTAVGGTVQRAIGRTVTGTSNAVGTVKRAIAKTVATGTVSTVGTVKRAIAKTLATATATAVGTIAYLKTWVETLGGGAEAIGSVIRKVFRTVTGTAQAVGTLTTTLYDIVYAMNQTIRQLFAKVQITYTDPYFSAGVVTAASETGRYTYTDQTVDNVQTEQYKWFSLHRNTLDGTFHPLPGDQSSSVGWWGTQLSDFVTGNFAATYPTLTITHAARIVERILVVGDDKLMEWPEDFTVQLYDAANVLQHTETVTGNAGVTFLRDLSPTHAGIAKQVLTITKWSRGDSVCKIAQFFTTLEETYLSEDGDIVTVHVNEAREFQGTTVPLGNVASSEITVRLNNIDGTFDPGNTSSPLYGYLKNNRAIKAWLGVDLYPSGVRRWYPLGVF